jgi:hypothetical protein
MLSLSTGLVEVLALHQVDRDLRPQQDAVAIGQLLDLWTQRVVGADHRGPKGLDPADQPAHMRGIQRRSFEQVLLVQVHATEVEQAAVEGHPPGAGHGDRAHAAVRDVAAQPPAAAVAQRQRGAV